MDSMYTRLMVNVLKTFFSRRPKRAYFDYCSITPTDPRVFMEMRKYYSSSYTNPSSLHASGVLTKKALDAARERIAKTMSAHADEVVMTASGTEANNLALFGFVEALRAKGREYTSMHIVASAIEHASVMQPLKILEQRGVRVSFVGVNDHGVVDADRFADALTTETILVSVMMVNNETGTTQQIKELSKIIKRKSPDALFHTDASQGFLYNEINVLSLGVHMLTLDGHKVYGPKGVGMLWVKRGIQLSPVIHGGGQESGLRSGTEALPQIAGFAKALEIAVSERNKETARIARLRELFASYLKGIRPDTIWNGVDALSPHIINISFPGADHEFLMFKLDAAGIEVSTKSSCLRDEEESYVLKAMGKQGGSIRISFGRFTVRRDVERLCLALKAFV